MGFFDKAAIRDEASLFKNEVALSYDFLPKVVPFRELQQQQVANAIKPLFVGRNGKNLVITGKPGIGKTVATKHLLREIDDNYPDDIITVFVNCWQLNSSFKVAEHICHQLGFRLTQNKKTNELFGIAEKMLNKSTAVFVFDEVDKAEEHDFLYELLENVYTKSMLLITNYPNWIDSLDDRIRSRLMPEMIHFKPYTQDEIKGILKERIQYAFIEQAFSDDALAIVAKKAHEVGDVRVGIYMLRQCGLLAQEKRLLSVTEEIAKEAIEMVPSYKNEIKVRGLGEEELGVYHLIRDCPASTMMALFERYQKNGGKGVYKTFTRRIKALEDANLVVCKNTGGGAKGNQTLVDLYKPEG